MFRFRIDETMKLAIPLVFALCVAFSRATLHRGGILYPRDSETRQQMTLDGLWNFVVSPVNDPLIGFRENWYQKDITKLSPLKVYVMPVPSSYNDIPVDDTVKKHVGLVWYQRHFFVPRSWANNTRVWLRFSAVSYAAQVWINQQLVMSHEIGHLPFQADVSAELIFGGLNQVTVACDNTLLPDTVPQGTVSYVETDVGKELVQKYSFDFFNYAGIHRPVTLYTTPILYIDDITIVTFIDGSDGIVSYKVAIEGDKTAAEYVQIIVKILDVEGNVVASKENVANCTTSNVTIPNAIFWWPYLMNDNPGYMYTLQVVLADIDNAVVIDVYRQPFGIRTVSWTNTSLFINNASVYLQGFGRHEDAELRGKGLDFVTVVRDYNLIKWIGANVYRTSHYPYAEEIMDLADQMGIMIIDECPSVDTVYFTTPLREKHKQSLTELYKRDKNRPSVIAWSVANEPRTQQAASDLYFQDIVQHVKNLDGNNRFVTLADAQNLHLDHSAKYMDIISFNMYNGWYQNPADLEQITGNLISVFEEWHRKYDKPILMSEYGAETIIGMHSLPSSLFTEEYQVQLMSKHFMAFDYLRKKGFFIGEFIWNFADFQTAQNINRAGGNRKGIFTRNRQPKASAHFLRRRYWALAKQLYNATPPTDVNLYVTSKVRDEL